MQIFVSDTKKEVKIENIIFEFRQLTGEEVLKIVSKHNLDLTSKDTKFPIEAINDVLELAFVSATDGEKKIEKSMIKKLTLNAMMKIANEVLSWILGADEGNFQ